MRLTSEASVRQITGLATVLTGVLALLHPVLKSVIQGQAVLFFSDLIFLAGLGVLWQCARIVYDKHDDEPLARSPQTGEWRSLPDMGRGDSLSTVYAHDMEHLAPLVWIQVLVYCEIRTVVLGLDSQPGLFELASGYWWYTDEGRYVTFALFTSTALLFFLVTRQTVRAILWANDVSRPFDYSLFTALVARVTGWLHGGAQLLPRLGASREPGPRGGDERQPLLPSHRDETGTERPPLLGANSDGAQGGSDAPEADDTWASAVGGVANDVAAAVSRVPRGHGSFVASKRWAGVRTFIRGLSFVPITLVFWCNGHPLPIYLIDEVWRYIYWNCTGWCVVTLVYTLVLVVLANDTTVLWRREGGVGPTLDRSILFTGSSTWRVPPASQDSQALPPGFVASTQRAYDIYQVFSTGLVLGLPIGIIYGEYFWRFENLMDCELIFGTVSSLYIAYTSCMVPQVNRYFWAEDVDTAPRPKLLIDPGAQALDDAEAGRSHVEV